MNVRKYLLVPRLLFLAIRAPHDQRLAWDRYWSEVARTGFDGGVLWDAGDHTEFAETVRRLYAHADPELSVVDLGCGNGRQARAFTKCAPRVLGLDRSQAAINRARLEAAESPPSGPGSLEFRVADVTAPGIGEQLCAERGEVNIHVRGMLHVVDPPDRPTVVANIKAMLGDRGTANVCETNVAGDPLDYLMFQGPLRPRCRSRCSVCCFRTATAVALWTDRTSSIFPSN
jgi:2-polyprenyl-3-methyl-5-hydroxy-6-metoxy-1,4-benzoquinol methylase